MTITLADVQDVIWCAIYLRQSKDPDGNELAVQRQRQDAVQLAERRGWCVREVITENDMSASGRRNRPGFDRLLELIKDDQVTVVLSWAMDRLSRNRADLVRLLDVGEEKKTLVSLVRGGDLDLGAPQGVVFAEILGSMARGEIKQKADRQHAAALQAQQAGLPYAGRRPFGFQGDKITHHPTEANAMRWAYERVVDGEPLARVAKGLTSQGFYTTQSGWDHGCQQDRCGFRRSMSCPQRIRRASEWTAQTLRAALLSPRYAGVRARTVRPKPGGNGKPTWEIIGSAQWQPIVDPEVFEAVKEILSDPVRRNAPIDGQAMLTGIALCGAVGCGAPVHGGRSAKSAGNGKTYRCSATTGHVIRAQAPVDRYIGLVVCERLGRDDARDLLLPQRPDTLPMRAELAAKRKKLADAPRLWSEGVLSDLELRDEKTHLSARIAELESILSAAGRTDHLAEMINSDDREALWASYTDDRRRSIVDTLTTVTLLPPGRGTRTFRPETVICTPKR